ncbi:ChaB family protein [Marinitenerispora sediminis]|uniref:Cation transport regulator ChaB n=1 Tax=Marinitenerispora sediminis TaxID=1931232 RepID=A0A368T140_9ACTN|nr:ChaB family protein [Marinitenerispora sediminis]RCV49995.1 cation transport regulator ChaB [Marinitenerispora sediminis]RCV51299.1 cation transport regulator ChaB [Marinitenerispora sediminis]RCV53206.1 cation transport regulator ChaB [Marinitenerispora sediminis]
MPARKEMPSTLQRSPKKAQDTWAEAHDSAVHTYGEGERAHRVAYAALKHEFEKVGDHWEPKGRKGPSDKQASNPRAPKQRGGDKKTAGGVDANASKKHLYERAREMDVAGRSSMSKKELVDALRKENAKRTRRARSS